MSKESTKKKKKKIDPEGCCSYIVDIKTVGTFFILEFDLTNNNNFNWIPCKKNNSRI